MRSIQHRHHKKSRKKIGKYLREWRFQITKIVPELVSYIDVIARGNNSRAWQWGAYVKIYQLQDDRDNGWESLREVNANKD